jgi:hypothetical protein
MVRQLQPGRALLKRRILLSPGTHQYFPPVVDQGVLDMPAKGEKVWIAA